MRHTQIMLSPIAAMLFLASSQTVAAEPAHAEIHACLLRQADALDFSGTVMAVQNGVPTSFARGLTAPGGTPITVDTRFNLGSAGKMFTGVAVGQLIEAGRISLDDRIGKYVDGLTPEASAVTIRQLLTHSSGLGNFFTPDHLAVLQHARGLGDLKMLLANERPAFTPGSRFSYSNSGYLLLGLMIERVSGQSYGDYLRVHVFGPAGMTATSLDPHPDRTLAAGMTAMVGPRAGSPIAGRPGEAPSPGVNPASGSKPLQISPEAALPGTSAGGAFSTVGDLQRFFSSLAKGVLVRPDIFQQLTAKQIVSGPPRGDLPELNYGFGFGTSSYEGKRWFGHNGGAPGLNAETAIFPDEGIALFVLSNRDPPAATEMFRRIRSALFDGQC